MKIANTLLPPRIVMVYDRNFRKSDLIFVWVFILIVTRVAQSV
jgi:hypothetical protein